MNRSVCVILSLAALLAAPVIPAHEEEDHGAVTVQGEILDLACYVPHGEKGEGHAACARSCVKQGQPMGLLTADGVVYVLYASHKDASAFEQAKEYAGTKVEIQGQEASNAGVRGLEVRHVKPL